MLDIQHGQFLGNGPTAWLTGVAWSVATYFLLRLVLRIASTQLTRWAARTDTHWDDAALAAVNQTKTWLVYVVAIFSGAALITLPERVDAVLSGALKIALFAQCGLWAVAVMNTMLARYREQRMQSDPASATTINILAIAGKLILGVIVLLLALDNVGVDVTALIAGLGVGGIAVALAVQRILGDILASLSIVLDKPFTVGDFLVLDSYLGSVEHIGLKTTRLRSLSGEQLIISNNDLLNARVRNFGRMRERRALFTIGVTYQTSRALLQRIPELIRAAIEAQPQTCFDRAHFKEYGDFALVFEAVYYVGNPDYATYMDTQQAVNLAIHAAFEREGIEFAYPTQTLFVHPARSAPEALARPS